MKVAETKSFQQADENLQLYHNVDKSICFDPWSLVVKGTNAHQRIGNKVFNRGMLFKFWYATKLDRPNQMFRIQIFTCPRAVNGVAITNGNYSSYLYRQPDGGTLGNGMLLSHEMQIGVKHMFDKIYTLNGSGNVLAADKEKHYLKTIFIKPRNLRTIHYLENNSSPANRLLIVCICPYDSYGSATSDNISTVAYNYTLYFKDV